MRRHLGADGLAWATPHLERLGALMGGPIAERAEETDRNPPRLEKYDRWGRDVSRGGDAGRRSRRRGATSIANSFSSPAFRRRGPRGRRRPGAAGGGLELPARPGRDRDDVRARHGRRHGRPPGRGVRARRRQGAGPGDLRRRRDGRRGGADAHGAHRRLRPRRAGDDRRRPTATPGGSAGSSGSPPTPTARRSSCWPSRRARPTAIRGIAPFLVLRERRDGSRNGVRIRRLKDKLGTKAVASAEVEFVDAEAFLLAPGGSAGRRRRRPATAAGLARMMELTNGARLGIAMMGLGCARRALVESLCYAQAREAFGAELVAPPAHAAQAGRADRRGGGGPGAGVRRLPRPAAAHRRAADQAAGGPPRHHRRQRRHRDPRRQRLHRAVAGRPPAPRRPGEHGLGGPRQHPVPRRPPSHGARRRRPRRSSTGCARPSAGRRAATRPRPTLVARADRRARARPSRRWRALDRTTAEARLYPLAQFMVDVYAAALLVEQAGWEQAELGSDRKELVGRLYVRAHLAPRRPGAASGASTCRPRSWSGSRTSATARSSTSGSRSFLLGMLRRVSPSRRRASPRRGRPDLETSAADVAAIPRVRQLGHPVAGGEGLLGLEPARSDPRSTPGRSPRGRAASARRRCIEAASIVGGTSVSRWRTSQSSPVHGHAGEPTRAV